MSHHIRCDRCRAMVDTGDGQDIEFPGSPFPTIDLCQKCFDALKRFLRGKKNAKSTT